MSIASIWWLIPILFVGELGAVAWRRRNRYPRFLFHLWAPTGYVALLLADVLLAALLTALLGGGSPAAADELNALIGWAIAVGVALLVTAGLTLFFRWITHTDITDIPD